MKLTNVYASYLSATGGETKAVDNVSIEVRDGEILGIAGESGCGKTTLAMVMSLIVRRPLQVKSGELDLDGQVMNLTNLEKAPNDWHGKMVALLPQRSLNSLNPTLRIKDFVVDVLRGHDRNIKPAEAIERARERLDMLSLPASVLESYPHQLSGGMRQRTVAVISTLLNPKVLICDEPSSALDVSTQKQLMELLRLLLSKGVISRICFITHDLPLLTNLADRIAVMYAGKIVEVNATQNIVYRARHPYTSALISYSLDPSPEVRKHRLSGIKGAPPDLHFPPPGCRFHPRCPNAMEICRTEEPKVYADANGMASCWLLENVKQEETAR